MPSPNGVVGSFWRCDYGHSLRSNRTVVGTIWGVSSAAVSKVAADREEMLALILGGLKILSEDEMGELVGVWSGPAVAEWPRDPRLVQVLRSLKGDPAAVVPHESQLAKQIFDCVEDE